MNTAATIARQLDDMTRHYNRGLAVDAALKVSAGLPFTLLTFGVLYWFGWFLGFLVARYLSLQAWQFGLLFATVFLAAATWSAWRNVNPLAGLRPLTDREVMITLVGQAAGLMCFSPRHATAGAAVLLIGGPAGLLHGVGIWTYRVRRNGRLIDDAATLLLACAESCPAREVREPAAALLLRRLGMIKVLSDGEAATLTVTDKGFKVLSAVTGKGDRRSIRRKRSRSRGTTGGITSPDGAQA